MRVCSVASVVSNSGDPMTVACRSPLSVGFSRQKYWSGLPCPPPGEEVLLPTQGLNLCVSCIFCSTGELLTAASPRKPSKLLYLGQMLTAFIITIWKKGWWQCVQDTLSLRIIMRFLIRSLMCSGELPWWLSGKESACRCRRRGLNPWVEKIPWRRKWQPTSVFLPRKSLCDHRELDRTQWLKQQTKGLNTTLKKI